MIGIEPKDPAYAAPVRENFDSRKFMNLIGAQPGCLECEIHLPHKQELSQQHGYYHGGIIGTIADSASG